MAASAKVNASDAMRQVTMEVEIVGMETFAVRVWIGRQLLKLACLVMGCGIKFKESCDG